MSITAAQVKALRDKTGAGMMDCKKVLVEAGGDEDKAVTLLRERGMAKAEKKAGRATSEGTIGVKIDGGTGVMVELQCETDFAAKNEEFSSFAAGLADKVYAGGFEKTEDLPEELTDLAELVTKIGENMGVGRIGRLSVESGVIGSYVHSNGKIGVLVGLNGATEADTALAKDLAMQVAATNPLCVSSDQVPTDLKEKEMAIYKQQAMAEGKPEEIAEKIILGRINKYYKEVCLMDQPFIKEDKKAVKDLFKGTEITVAGFVRLALGEDAE